MHYHLRIGNSLASTRRFNSFAWAMAHAAVVASYSGSMTIKPIECTRTMYEPISKGSPLCRTMCSIDKEPM